MCENSMTTKMIKYKLTKEHLGKSTIFRFITKINFKRHLQTVHSGKYITEKNKKTVHHNK